ncbi:MAG: hypothetical protein M1834_006133 [Cirrosporium novae-zelandiae]|nr:MAG: hypothetical protein M1834_006133 [Cirrosporium novae-zelandiae]
MSSSESPLLSSLNKDGFVLIPSLIPQPLLSSLCTASSAVTSLARTSKWPYIRTLPKQFPPWPSTPSSDGIWGVQHLLHPDLPNHELFAKLYFSNEILDVVKQLLRCGDDDLMMELFNMLVGVEKDFELRWHRDSISNTATTEEELERLAIPKVHSQYNIALHEDESLVVVPGSHLRPRTEEERNAEPFEKNMLGMKVVKLQPGDAIFYNNNILHRGVYKAGKKRMTLHGSVGSTGTDGGAGRARNLLQHGIREWIEKSDFSELDGDIKVRAEAMRNRLLKMGKQAGDVVVYPHDD